MIGRKAKAHIAFKNILIYIVILCYITNTSLSYALPVGRQGIAISRGTPAANKPEIKIPSSAGIVSEVYNPDSPNHIIIIQDRHADELTQRNISSIIDKLINDYSLDLVYLEGASKKLDASFYDSYPDDSIKEKIARFLLKKSVFTGPEFYRIIHPETKAKFAGVENRTSYLKHLASFNKPRPGQKEALDFITQLKSFVDKLKIHIYSRQLIFLDKRIESYNLGNKKLSEFIEDLTELAKKRGIPLKDYAEVLKFQNLIEKEKRIDFKEAESQCRIS